MYASHNLRVLRSNILRRQSMQFSVQDVDQAVRHTSLIRCKEVQLELSDVSKFTSEHKQMIPSGYLKSFMNNTISQTHLRWMIQKDSLQQNMMLTSFSGAGAIHCRRLVMAYAELVQRPIALTYISPDTTFEDLLFRNILKKRHASNNKYLEMVPQSTVTEQAARNGHILILDGLHRAERNVLSSLVSLLERRETFLVDDSLKLGNVWGDDVAQMSPNVTNIHDNFRIVALWTKSKDSLDPTIRSLFQVNRVDPPPSDVIYEQLLSSQQNHETMASHSPLPTSDSEGVIVPVLFGEKFARQLSILSTIMKDSTISKHRIFPFPTTSAQSIHKIISQFPQTSLVQLLHRSYPYATQESRLRTLFDKWPKAASSRTLLLQTCEELGILPLEEVSPVHTNQGVRPYAFNRVEIIEGDPYNVSVVFSRRKVLNKEGIFASMFNDYSLGELKIIVPSGGAISLEKESNKSKFISTIVSNDVLVAMFQEHYAGRDILLVAPRGEGKTAIAKHFCSLVGYDAHVFTIHTDMKADDLLWKKSRNAKGNNEWTETPLISAARLGQVCILDGIEKLSSDILSVLQGFLTDRELILPDGTKFSANTSSNAVHKSFRVIALASIDVPGCHATPRLPTWLTDEVTSMFASIPLPSQTFECCKKILAQHNTDFSSTELYKLFRFYEKMLEVSHDCGILPLSIRSMIKFVKKGIIPDIVMGKGSLYGSLRSHVLYDLLQNSERFAFNFAVLSVDIEGKIPTFKQKEKVSQNLKNLKIELRTSLVKIGEIEISRLHPKQVELVPSIDVNESPNRILLIQLIMREWSRGERSFMMIGNTGTGMKQFCDNVCGLINHEREYINLNQKWTLEELTKTSEQGVNQSDSTLVRAMLKGFAVVIDGIDDAANEIKDMFQILAQDGVVYLADGKKIYRDKIEDGRRIHPNFAVWILCRRPKSLVQGDDFFNKSNDSFSTHFVPVPDIESTVNDVRPSFPRVEESKIQRILRSFDELRTLFHELDHPYSTKEAIAIIKHLQMFPKDDPSIVLHDVLDFDSYDSQQYQLFENNFKQYNFQFPPYKDYQDALNRSLSCGRLNFEYTSRFEVSDKVQLSQSVDNSLDPNSVTYVPKSSNFEADEGFNSSVESGSQGEVLSELGLPDVLIDEEENNAIYNDLFITDRILNTTVDSGDVIFQEHSTSIGEQISESVDHILKEERSNMSPDLGGAEVETLITKPIQDITRDVEANINQSIYLQSELRAQEIIATKLEGKGSSEYATYHAFIDTFIDEINTLRNMFQHISNKQRVCLLVDCSSSMARMNSLDNRFVRALEISAMMMETCWGMEKKWDYSIVGHNGISSHIEIVSYGDPPANGRDRFRLLQKMIAQSQFCNTVDDNTLNAIVHVASSGSSDFMIVISDAYLEEHGVTPDRLVKTLREKCRTRTKIYFIFVAGFISEAVDFIDRLPNDRAYVCRDYKDVPYILQLILENLDSNYPKQEGVKEKLLDLGKIRDKVNKKITKSQTKYELNIMKKLQ